MAITTHSQETEPPNPTKSKTQARFAHIIAQLSMIWGRDPPGLSGGGEGLGGDLGMLHGGGLGEGGLVQQGVRRASDDRGGHCGGGGA